MPTTDHNGSVPSPNLFIQRRVPLLCSHTPCGCATYLGDGLNGSAVLQQELHHLDSVLLAGDVQRRETILEADGRTKVTSNKDPGTERLLELWMEKSTLYFFSSPDEERTWKEFALNEKSLSSGLSFLLQVAQCDDFTPLFFFFSPFLDSGPCQAL